MGIPDVIAHSVVTLPVRPKGMKVVVHGDSKFWSYQTPLSSLLGSASHSSEASLGGKL